MATIKEIIDEQMVIVSENIYKKILKEINKIDTNCLKVSIEKILNSCSKEKNVKTCFHDLITKMGLTETDELDIAKCTDNKDKLLLLQISCIVGDLQMCKYLIQICGCIDMTNTLMFGVIYNHLDIVKYLVEKGIDIDVGNSYAIIRSAGDGNLDIVKYLVENGASIDNKNLLYSAIGGGNLEIVKYLVEKGANINDPHLLSYAVECDNFEIVKYLVDKGANVNNSSTLSNAVLNNNLEIVKYLVEKGANANDLSSLYNAINNDNLEILKYLVGKGANVNRSDLLSTAASCGNIEIVKYLVEVGANIKYTYAITNATSYGNFEIFKYLVDIGTNDKNDDKEILIIAVRNGYIDIVKYFVEKGTFHKNLLKISISYNRYDVTKYLLQKYNEKKIDIPDSVITKRQSEIAKILFPYAKESQHHLFHPEIVKQFTGC